MNIDLQETRVGGFNYEFLRTISYQATAGAALGECVAAAASIHEGDFQSWITAWSRLADRVATLAETALEEGDTVSARAAAFDPRIKACIANSLLFDVGEAWRAAWPAPLRNAPETVFDAMFTTLSRANPHMRWALDQARWTMGIGHPHEFFKAFAPYTLWGIEARFHCPLLALFGEDEIAQTNEQLIEETARYLDALTCSKTVHIFTHEEGVASHCQMGGLAQAQAVIFAWLEELFKRSAAAQPGGEAPLVNMSADFLPLLARHHGKELTKRLQGLALFNQQPREGNA